MIGKGRKGRNGSNSVLSLLHTHARENTGNALVTTLTTLWVALPGEPLLSKGGVNGD
jgi:hypothetical protein